MTIQQCYEKVWEFRHKHHDFWPTPNVHDSLMYAFTEMGEALSDFLREERTDHKRNHPRQTNVYGELADCAIMLLTALGPGCPPGADPDDFDVPKVSKYIHINGIAAMVGNCLTGGYMHIIAALRGIDEYPGMNLNCEIDKRLARIKAKHVDGLEHA